MEGKLKIIARIAPAALFLILSFYAFPAIAATIHIPFDLPTIQSGIDGASDGDLVLVAPGTYFENIDFLGKAIELRSEGGAHVSVIDGNRDGLVVRFFSEETEDAVIDGFTIRNGDGDVNGGGIECYFSSPTITNCRITENSAINGGGIYCYESSPTITNCTISLNSAGGDGGGMNFQISSPVIANCRIFGNSAGSFGGGIRCYSSSFTMANCSISENSSLVNGGGIYCSSYSSPLITNCKIVENISQYNGGGLFFSGYSSSATIANCAIAGNSADIGGGIYCCNDSSLTIVNCILWDDTAPEGPEISVDYDSTLTFRYCDVQGGEAAAHVEPGGALHWLEGNIDDDPLFIGGGDYHLGSGSPCIDAGDPTPPYSDACFPPSLGAERNDMGAFGGPRACGWDCWDQDGDDYYDEACGGRDCDDSNPLFSPGVDEACDEIDWNCSGDPLDKDVDGDGFIDDDPVCMGDDCDDSDPDVYPGADEICDGKDSDCDGTVPGDEADGDSDGWVICAGDCDDADPLVNPGVIESRGGGNCDDGLDNDCDGLIDTDPECTAIFVPALQPTIQAAIDSGIDGDLILVAPGTYYENIDFLDKAIALRSAAGPEETIIDGSQAGTVVTFTDLGAKKPVLDGFTIRNGSGIGLYGGDRAGGIYCISSSPTIMNCTITGNRVCGYEGLMGDFCYGGGIYCGGFGSHPRIVSCTIEDNRVQGWVGAGGGIYCDISTAPTIVHCTISKNSVSATGEGFGAGIGCTASAPVIESCSISLNGGAYKGGGIGCRCESSPTIRNCTISRNSGISSGGGIFCSYDSSPEVTNCTFFENHAGRGGGIRCDQDSSPVITNCTLYGNTARYSGGGICSSADSSPTITNSILWEDEAPEGPEISILSASNLIIRYSDVRGGEAGVDVETGSTLQWLHGNIDADPIFIGDEDFHLEAGSPCIDAGTDAGVYTDIDGQPRPFGGGFDMGADEFWPGACEPRIVPISRGPIALFLVPALVFILLGKRLFG